jgi:hypothetical protein
MSYSISDLMGVAVDMGALGVHLHGGEIPVLELRDGLFRIEGPRLEPEAGLVMFRTIAPPEEIEQLMRNGLSRFWHQLNDDVWFGVLAFREQGSVRLELRRALSP